MAIRSALSIGTPVQNSRKDSEQRFQSTPVRRRQNEPASTLDCSRQAVSAARKNNSPLRSAPHSCSAPSIRDSRTRTKSDSSSGFAPNPTAAWNASPICYTLTRGSKIASEKYRPELSHHEAFARHASACSIASSTASSTASLHSNHTSSSGSDSELGDCHLSPGSTEAFGCEAPSAANGSAPPSHEACLIVFDWDDTLFPTSGLKPVLARGGTTMGKALAAAQLCAHARHLESVLRAARAVARVAIVTLAERPWVVASGEHLHGLDVQALFRELDITVYYAREEGRPGAFDDEEEWGEMKQCAIKRCIREWRARGSPNARVRQSVFSIGDSEIEREALKQLFADRDFLDLFVDRPFCKTLKLMESPSLSELGIQLQQLTERLELFSNSRQNFDIILNDAAQLARKSFAGF